MTKQVINFCFEILSTDAMAFIHIDEFGRTFMDKMVELDNKQPGLIKELPPNFFEMKLVILKFQKEREVD
jgi:hypothetical protein